MPPLEAVTKEIDEKYMENLVKFVNEIRTGKLQGSFKIAGATVTLLENIINDSQNATAYELCAIIREVGARLSKAAPRELVIANMVRRVLRAIRDEHRAHSHQGGGGAGEGGAGAGAGGAGAGGGGESLQRLVAAPAARRATLSAEHRDLREPLRDHIAELRLEIESSISSICATSCEHVHAEELILSAGAGELLLGFLAAARARRYRLLLAETAQPPRETHAMAARLSALGAAVTVISNASVFAVMSRVNKVVVGCGGVLAGGAVLADAGVHCVTLAAKHYSVPVLVLCPLLALSALHAQEPRLRSLLAAPRPALGYESECAGAARVESPLYDCVPPDHVTLFITNLGGSSPSYIYRLLSELYDPNDYEL